MRKYRITTIDGTVVCDDCTLEEARHCRMELNVTDKKDNNYTPGYYRIEEEKRKEL